MKILLQPEAHHISNKQLLDNSNYLIDLLAKMSLTKSIFTVNLKSKINT